MLGSGSKVRVRSGQVGRCQGACAHLQGLLAARLSRHHPASASRRHGPPAYARVVARRIEVQRQRAGARDCRHRRPAMPRSAPRASAGRTRARSSSSYLDPVHQGLGLGEHLFEGCRHALDMRKLNGLIIWALLDNTQACDFYWRARRPARSPAPSPRSAASDWRRSRSPGAERSSSNWLAIAPMARTSTGLTTVTSGLLPRSPSRGVRGLLVEVARLAVGDAPLPCRRLRRWPAHPRRRRGRCRTPSP